ncbi:hypothetical protein GIB67_003418 [Kingdonia uniflora]|uniref:Uncharacterized protein n=1 Tax=Kingdonia uniflora TaxID=39325 RepID=A0A7J7P9B2_9MAGN|nr:hypothetical protein GIB67_003418 [Kingdonia uniflora]
MNANKKNKKAEEADVPLKKKQVAPGEGLEVVKDLMVDDDVEVGREVNFKAISSEYGGDLLEWKKGDKKNNDKKDVEEKVKSEEEQPQIAEEEDSEPPTVVVYNNGKKDVQHANEASVNQIIVVSVEEQTLEVEKIKDEASQASADQITVVSVEEQTIEVAQTEVVISHQEEDVGEASQEVEQNKEEVVEGKDDDDRNSQNKLDLESLMCTLKP